MITESLLHFPHIGPKRLTKLHAQGLRNWHDVVARANELSTGIRDAVVEETQRCLAALESQDIAYFVANLAPKDQWRILAHYIDEVSFFDIETAGLERNDPIS